MIIVDTSILVVEQTPKKWLLPLFVFPGWAPVIFWPLQKALQDQQVVWPRLLSNYCPCTGIQSMWDFFCMSRVESLFLQPLALSFASSSSLHSQMFWGLIFLVQDPNWRTQCGTQNSRSLGKTSATVIILWFVCCPPERVSLLHLCAFYPSVVVP